MPDSLIAGKYDPALRTEQVRLLYRGIGTSIAAALLIAGLLSLSQRAVVEHGVVAAWFGMFVLVSLVRIGLAVAYTRKPPGLEQVELWYRLFVAGAAVSGLVWGAGAWLLFPPEHVVHQVFLGIVVSSVAAGGIISLSASLPAAGLFLLFSTIPITIRLLASELDVMVNLGYMCVVFLAVMGAGLFRINHNILQNIQLKLQSESRERALNLARLEAEKASRIKSEFLSNMSHELRTPMNAVLGMSDVLLSTDLNTEQREYTELISSSGRTLMEMIDDILDYANMEQGQLDLKARNFSVTQVLDPVRSHFEHRAKDKNLQLSIEYPEHCPEPLEGDMTRLQQVLMNLVDNAIKFTEQGTVRVRGSCSMEGSESVSVLFEVQDTGVGVPLEARNRLFTVFSQADNSSTRKYGGAGLGLAIAKQLVERMGGEIGFDSESEVGSRFWFTLNLPQGHPKVA